MLKHVFAVLIAAVSIVSGEIHNFKIDPISYEWESEPDFGQCKNLFLDAFIKCYDPIPVEVLRKASRPAMIQWLSDAFDEDYAAQVAPGSTKLWLTAKEEDRAVGFLQIDLEKSPDEVYLALMAVDPNHQREGIARAMVTSLLEQLPDTNRFVVITRIANEEARQFYAALGFVESSYIHEGYSRDLYIGYELIR